MIGSDGWGLVTVATWPRQLGVLYVIGLAFAWLLKDVFDAATWVQWVSCLALGLALSAAIPSPVKVRDKLEKGAPHGRGE